jgi:hypothetical protein
MAAAHVRERCTIPGISARTAFLCRDKVAMKEVLRKAGVPTAASAGVKSFLCGLPLRSSAVEESSDHESEVRVNRAVERRARRCRGLVAQPKDGAGYATMFHAIRPRFQNQRFARHHPLATQNDWIVTQGINASLVYGDQATIVNRRAG